MRRSGLILSGIMLLGFAVGCQNKLHDENIALHRENRELRAKMTDMETRLGQAPDPSQVQMMQQELAARDARIAELQNQLRQPAPGASDNLLAGIEVTRDPVAGTVTVNVPGDVLFDSGKADIKNSARSTLDKIAAAIKKDFAGKQVIVIGHTDTDPISRTKDQWKDNLDLSAARARTVEKYLQEQGLNNRQVGTQAWGDTQPRGSKAKSRRVEIVVVTR